jgi:sec-independent protein translocase protein TatB
MIREADMEDVRRQATELRNLNIGREVEKTIDPSGSLRDAFDPNITARPRAEDDAEAESDRLAHGESQAPAQLPAHLPAPVAEQLVPAAPADLKIPEPATVPADSPDKRA